MASANCVCCGMPTTAPEPVPVEPEECCCGCYDCDDCEECFHDDEPEFVTPVVLCDECTEDGEGCGPDAWHCRCGRSCDGSACPGPPRRPEPEYRNGSTCGPGCASHGYLRGPDDGGSA